jgi:hypothetical protein
LTAVDGRLVAPQPFDQAVDRDRPAGLEREHRQNGARLRGDRKRLPVGARLHRSQESNDEHEPASERIRA